jgi:NAD+ diphosphatase
MQKPMTALGPWPALGYINSIIERAAERRTDLDFLSARAADANCGFYLVGGEMVVLKATGDLHNPVFSSDEIASLATGPDRIFLGVVKDAGRFGLPIAAAAIETLKADARFVVTDLRSIAVQGLVAPDHLPPLAEAKALLHWHARHRFCSNCGHATNIVDGGWRRDCPQCHYQHFPRTDPVVIMLTVRGDQCLLGRQSRFGAGMWSCLAGFVEPGETIEEAARRETLEEAGIVCGRVRYFASQPWPFPSSIMIGCHAEAISSDIKVDYNELEDARWFTRADAAAMLMRRHEGGLSTPPPVAIAHHIIRAWVENGDDVLT